MIASQLIIEAGEQYQKRPTQLKFEEMVDVVQAVVKNCSIPAVVGRSELLKAFNEQMSIDHPWYYSVPDEDIDNYVKSL